MASDTFYGIFAFLGFIAVMMGVIMMNAGYGHPKPEEVLGGQISIIVGILFLCVLAGGAYFDLRPRFREWNLERKSVDMNLKGKEREIEKKKREFEMRYPKENQTKNESSNTISSQKQTNVTPTQTSDALPKQTTKPMEIKPDESVLITGGNVPEKLKRETDTIEQIKKESPIQKQETEYIDGDYKHAISMDAHMKCLWALSKAPNHSFPNKQKLILDAQGHDGDRSEYYKAINDLIDSGLVHILDKRKYADEIRTTGRLELTKIGIELSQIARNKKIVQWNNFVETFKDKLS